MSLVLVCREQKFYYFCHQKNKAGNSARHIILRSQRILIQKTGNFQKTIEMRCAMPVLYSKIWYGLAYFVCRVYQCLCIVMSKFRTILFCFGTK